MIVYNFREYLAIRFAAMTTWAFNNVCQKPHPLSKQLNWSNDPDHIISVYEYNRVSETRSVVIFRRSFPSRSTLYILILVVSRVGSPPFFNEFDQNMIFFNFQLVILYNILEYRVFKNIHFMLLGYSGTNFFHSNEGILFFTEHFLADKFWTV